jgi:tetratricopeptide (TPR) repeat protein
VADTYGPESWDEHCFAEITIHIVDSVTYKSLTGDEAPPCPITVEHYKEMGIPWYSYYDEKLPGLSPSRLFGRIKSVDSIDRNRRADQPVPGSVEIDPDNVLRIHVPTRAERIEALWKRAQFSLKRGFYQIAAREASLALDLIGEHNPTAIIDLLAIRAHSHLNLGNFHDAQADATSTLHLNSDHTGMRLVRASACLELDEPLLAKEDADAILSQFPDNRMALLIRGHSFFRIGDFTGATADAARLLTDAPGDSGAVSLLGLLSRSIIDSDEVRRITTAIRQTAKT